MTSDHMREGAKSFFGAYVKLLAAGVVLAGTLQLGSIDFPRTVYNRVIGEDEALKQHLFDYVSKGINREISREHGYKNESGTWTVELDLQLHKQFDPSFDESRYSYPLPPLDPQNIPIGKLWDASEDYAHDGLDSLIGPRF